MKNYFKKFSIMFAMTLAIIGVGAVQNVCVANAATVGQQLTAPENGWIRYDDYDTNIVYSKDFYSGYDGPYYMSTVHGVRNTTNGTINFKFYGTKLRIISAIYPEYSDKIQITIDGASDYYSEKSPLSELTAFVQTVVYEKTSLPLGVHNVSITKVNNGAYIGDFHFDAIDIDANGYLSPYNENLSLDKTSLGLTIGNSQLLTATVTPAGSEVVWSSSDTTIATVDSTGKVMAIKEGQATITAQIKGSVTKATCIVNITKEGINGSTITNPVNTGTNTGVISGTTVGTTGITISTSNGIITIPSGTIVISNGVMTISSGTTSIPNGTNGSNIGNSNNSGNSGNNYSNNNNSNSNNNYYYNNNNNSNSNNNYYYNNYYYSNY